MAEQQLEQELPGRAARAAAGMLPEVVSVAGQERSDVEVEWATIAEAASGVAAQTASSHKIPAQGSRGGKKKQRPQPAGSKELSEEEQLLDEVLEMVAQQHTPGEEGAPFVDDENKAKLAANPSWRAAISASLDRVQERLAQKSEKGVKSPEDIATETQIREGYAFIRRGLDACTPEHERLTAEFEHATAVIERASSGYHAHERKIKSARQRGAKMEELTELRAQRVHAITIGRTLSSKPNGLRLAIEKVMVKRVAGLENDALNKGTDEVGILESFRGMMRGIKLEIASLDALRFKFSTPTNSSAGWRVEVATIDEDLQNGTDLKITVVLADGSAEVVGLDVKASGAFRDGVRKGKFISLSGHPGFAIKEVGGKKILVVDAEHELLGRGLMSGGTATVRRGGVQQTLALDLFNFRLPEDFAEGVMKASRTFATLVRSQRGGAGSAP